MIKALAAVAILLLAVTSTRAADCPYVGDDGGKLVFVSNSADNDVIYSPDGKEVLHCGWGINGDTGGEDIVCNDSLMGHVIDASPRDHSEHVIVFLDQTFRLQSC